MKLEKKAKRWCKRYLGKKYDGDNWLELNYEAAWMAGHKARKKETTKKKDPLDELFVGEDYDKGRQAEREDLRALLEAALSSEKKALAERNKECEKIKKDKNKILDDNKRAKLVYWTTYESGFNIGGALGMKAGKIEFARELLAELEEKK